MLWVSAGVCIHGVSILFCSLGKITGCSWEEEIQLPSTQARAGFSGFCCFRFSFFFFFSPADFQREAEEPVADEGKLEVVSHSEPAACHPAPQQSTSGAIAAHAGVCIIC